MKEEVLQDTMTFKNVEDSINYMFSEHKVINFFHTSYAACFQFDKKFFVKKPLNPEGPDS